MTTVKVLIDHVGNYMAGDIVTDAPAGLVELAEKGIKNAGTGQLVAEIVSEEVPNTDEDFLKELKAKAKSLKVKDYGKMNADELTEAIAAIETAGGGAGGE